MQKVIAVCSRAIDGGNKLLFVGNGGSATQCEHIAGEFVCSGFPAIALTSVPIITALANDYDYSEVFSRQIRVLAKKGDVLFALSTSGRSENIIKGAKIAQEIGVYVIGITGKGTMLSEISDYAVCFVGTTPEIQNKTIEFLHNVWSKII